MGLKSASSLVYAIKGLSIKSVKNILKNTTIQHDPYGLFLDSTNVSNERQEQQQHNCDRDHQNNLQSNQQGEHSDQRSKHQQQSTDCNNGRYCIDVDCNWVAYNLGGMVKQPDKAVSLTCNFLEVLARSGFRVTPICDGDLRHHSKRASIERVAEAQKAKVKSHLARYKLLAVSQ